MNFTFQRNPKRLLELCGMSAVRDRRQEKLFMEKAAALDAQALRPLVLVIGGFLDQILGNSYAVSARYPADLRAKHDVWFREHYESRKMRGIVRVSREGVECPTLMRCPSCDSGGREGGDGLQQNQRRFGFMIIRNSSMQKQNVSAKRLCFSGVASVQPWVLLLEQKRIFPHNPFLSGVFRRSGQAVWGVYV